MLAKYKKRSALGAAVWVLTFLGIFATMPFARGQNIWESANPTPAILVVLNIIVLWYSFWAYAKAKGYSDVVGLLLPLLSILGLVILFALKDRRPEFGPLESELREGTTRKRTPGAKPNRR